MRFRSAPIPGLFLVDLQPNQDERGSFSRIYCQTEFKEIGLYRPWVQINYSKNTQGGTLRGLHFQYSPAGEDKLICCVRGRIFDVAVDLRAQSPTFLQWYGLELSAASPVLIFIPQGFAHGFQTLCDDCEVIYHHTEFYQPQLQSGIRYNDPTLKIIWPLPISCISSKDLELPVWAPSNRGIQL